MSWSYAQPFALHCWSSKDQRAWAFILISWKKNTCAIWTHPNLASPALPTSNSIVPATELERPFKTASRHLIYRFVCTIRCASIARSRGKVLKDMLKDIALHAASCTYGPSMITVIPLNQTQRLKHCSSNSWFSIEIYTGPYNWRWYYCAGGSPPTQPVHDVKKLILHHERFP